MRYSRRSMKRAAVIAATALLAAVFLLRFAPSRLLLIETARPAIAALVVLLGAFACGLTALRVVKSSDDSLPSAILIGIVTLGTINGAAALISTAIIPFLTIAAAFAGAYLLGKRDFTFTRVHPLLAIAIGVAFIEAITPVNSPDELVYKLAIPHAWQLFGRMVELPLNSNSYLAMALHSADAGALILGGGIAAKLVHFGLYLASLSIVRRVGGEWAAIMFAFTPALMIIAGWAWSEWAVLGLLLLSYERWSIDDTNGGACALGCAIATKYTALPWLLAAAIVSRKHVLRVAMIVTLFGAFFYVRNAAWTGSPIAPLLLPNAPQVTDFRGNAWLGLVRGDDIFDPRIVDESLGIVLPLAFLAGLFAWKKQRDLVLLGLIQMPILLTIGPGSRNIITGVAPIAIAGIALLEEWMPRRLAAFAAAIPLLAQLTLVAFTLESYDLARYLSGQENESQYLARARAFTKPYDWIAHNSPRDATILVLAENRTFYLDRRFIAAGNLDGPRIAAWLGSFANAEVFRAELQRRRVTHIVIHAPWYRVGAPPSDVLAKEFVLDVPPPVHAMLMQYLGMHASLRYRDGEYLVYATR